MPSLAFPAVVGECHAEAGLEKALQVVFRRESCQAGEGGERDVALLQEWHELLEADVENLFEDALPRRRAEPLFRRAARTAEHRQNVCDHA